MNTNIKPQITRDSNDVEVLTHMNFLAEQFPRSSDDDRCCYFTGEDGQSLRMTFNEVIEIAAEEVAELPGRSPLGRQILDDWAKSRGQLGVHVYGRRIDLDSIQKDADRFLEQGKSWEQLLRTAASSIEKALTHLELSGYTPPYDIEEFKEDLEDSLHRLREVYPVEFTKTNWELPQQAAGLVGVATDIWPFSKFRSFLQDLGHTCICNEVMRRYYAGPNRSPSVENPLEEIHSLYLLDDDIALANTALDWVNV